MHIIYKYNKLRGRIVEKYRSQTAFAEALGLTKQALSLKLTGKIGISQKDINRWMDMLDISVDEIGEYFFA